MEDIAWIGHASFCFIDQESGSRIYYVDPFQLGERKFHSGDLIFITHAHFDHCSPEDVKKIMNEETIVVAPPDCLEALEIPNNQRFAVHPNQQTSVKNFSFSTIPAYNILPGRTDKHPKSNNWVGYIFDLNGRKVYHAGDTDFIPEMKELKKENLDIAMLPMGGTYTMDWIEAAEAANAIGAKLTIPMHYRKRIPDTYREAEENFKNAVANSQVVILSELQ